MFRFPLLTPAPPRFVRVSPSTLLSVHFSSLHPLSIPASHPLHALVFSWTSAPSSLVFMLPASSSPAHCPESIGHVKSLQALYLLRSTILETVIASLGFTLPFIFSPCHSLTGLPPRFPQATVSTPHLPAPPTSPGVPGCCTSTVFFLLSGLPRFLTSSCVVHFSGQKPDSPRLLPLWTLGHPSPGSVVPRTSQ